MKLILSLLLLFTVSISTHARIHLYSREAAEKYAASLKKADSLRVADSLRAIDSLRIADSLHVADSLMIIRYKVIDAETKKEHEKMKKEKETVVFKPLEIDSSKLIPEDTFDNISARTIVINENSPYSREIDSLQKMVDSLYNVIHDHDPWFKNMKKFPISEKKRYMIYLLDNHFKDTAQILTCCNQLYQMYSTRISLLSAIRKSQTNNSKSFMSGHIEIIKQQLTELSDFIVALSTETLLIPQRRNDPDPQ
jgi:phosphopantetheine adenylyltransferase